MNIDSQRSDKNKYRNEFRGVLSTVFGLKFEFK